MRTYTDDYANMLSYAMKRYNVRTYVLTRLEMSLGDIGIASECIARVIEILVEIFKDHSFTGEKLSGLVSRFRNDWHVHLERTYFEDYERTRWSFIREHVLSNLNERRVDLGRCLDIGCGRGCITESLVSNGYTTFASGIDAVDFSNEWRERKESKTVAGKGTLLFKQVSVQNVGDWLRSSEKFDVVFMFYVLHHSTDYWVARTIREVKRYLNPDGIIVILEDSLITDKLPDEANDPNKLTLQWRHWAKQDNPYCLSAGFDVQAVLDFVAVQLLAGFQDVSMPCNYKLGEEWQKAFLDIGLQLVESINLGFPNERDIDVPQAVFILKSKRDTVSD